MVTHPSLLVLSAQDWCCHCAKALSLSSQGLAMPVKGRGAGGGKWRSGQPTQNFLSRAPNPNVSTSCLARDRVTDPDPLLPQDGVQAYMTVHIIGCPGIGRG